MMTMAGFGLEENKASVSFDPQLNQLSFHIDVARKVQALERTLSEGWLTCWETWCHNHVERAWKLCCFGYGSRWLSDQDSWWCGCLVGKFEHAAPLECQLRLGWNVKMRNVLSGWAFFSQDVFPAAEPSWSAVVSLATTFFFNCPQKPCADNLQLLANTELSVPSWQTLCFVCFMRDGDNLGSVVRPFFLG